MHVGNIFYRNWSVRVTSNHKSDKFIALVAKAAMYTLPPYRLS
jgi:hypothetical protein